MDTFVTKLRLKPSGVTKPRVAAELRDSDTFVHILAVQARLVRGPAMHVRPNVSCGALLLAALIGSAPTVRAADIVGRVALSGEAVAGAVVSIENVTEAAVADGRTVVIDHRDLSFVPHVLVVRAGTTVRFENSDGMPCRIYSISPAGLFVLRSQGQPATVTFDRPGVIEVRCADHDRLYAYVVIKGNGYFASTDASGTFEISNVPPGRYTLQAWYEGKVLKQTTVHVGAGRLTVDFVAERPAREAGAGQRLDRMSPTRAPGRIVESFRRFLRRH